MSIVSEYFCWFRRIHWKDLFFQVEVLPHVFPIVSVENREKGTLEQTLRQDPAAKEQQDISGTNKA